LLFLVPVAVRADDTAILREGPVSVRGIPYLPPNVLSAFRGDYVIDPGDGGKGAPLVRAFDTPEPPAAVVVYTRRPLVLPEDWPAVRCRSLMLLQVRGEESYTLCYRDGNGYTLFFAFPETGQPPDACRFVESFVRRFQLLVGFLGEKREPPFPAILRLAN
jgi:hypothetical protein